MEFGYQPRLTTNYRTMKKFVLVIIDSRGSWLHNQLRQFQSRSMSFKVIFKKGAGLKRLWEVAEWYLLSRHVDLILVMGGVCDMTDKINIGNRRFFWPLSDMDKTFADISATMRDIARNFRLLNTNCKFVFMPDPGMDLIRLNKIPHPVPWRELIVQEELEEHLSLLHLYTRALNSYMGSLTPWTLDISHSHRNGNLHPVYDRMYDGLHFSRSQVIKLASEIDRYARDILKEPEVSIILLIINETLFTDLSQHLYMVASSGHQVSKSYGVFIMVISVHTHIQMISSDYQVTTHFETITTFASISLCFRIISSDCPVADHHPNFHHYLWRETPINTATSSGCQLSLISHTCTCENESSDSVLCNDLIDVFLQILLSSALFDCDMIHLLVLCTHLYFVITRSIIYVQVSNYDSCDICFFWTKARPIT